MTEDPIQRIKPVPMFATPADMPALEDYLDRLPRDVRGIATVAAMMAWNLACKVVNQGEQA